MSHHIEPCDAADISAIDLRKEIDDAQASGRPVETFRVVEIGADGFRKAVSGSLVWFPEDSRAGIEFGADADWTDASGPEDALRRWQDGDMIA